MTVAQIKSMYHLMLDHGLTDDKKVKFTMWREKTHVTLSFMNPLGQIWRYDIERDGTYEGETSA